MVRTRAKNKMKTAQKTEKEINLSPSEVLLVRAYRRLKQVEKHLADKLGKTKLRILGLDSDNYIGLENGKKVVSVTTQAGRATFNLEAFRADYKAINLDEYMTQGEPFKVVRLH